MVENVYNAFGCVKFCLKSKMKTPFHSTVVVKIINTATFFKYANHQKPFDVLNEMQ